MDQEIGHLQKGAALGQFLDRVTTVAKNALLAVDVGDGASAAGRVEKGWIVADYPRTGPVRRDLLEFGGRDRAIPYGNFVAAAGAVIDDGERLFGHLASPSLVGKERRVAHQDPLAEDEGHEHEGHAGGGNQGR